MRPVKVVVIYSLDGGVGKTTLSAVIGVAKGYTLLIDADWEKAELSQLFRAPRRDGWLAPFYGRSFHVHQISPSLYLIPGYDAVDYYRREGSPEDLEEALAQWVQHAPRIVDKLRLPVDAVVIDTTPALRPRLLEGLSKLGARMLFVGDVRLLSRISDIKAEQYKQYMQYSFAVVINQVDKGDVMTAKAITPYVVKHVSGIKDYRGESVVSAILRDSANRRSIEELLTKIKS
ncbi:ParA family protein [Pyrobaculum aerophilum]|uniref:ATPase n=2 Tax=Pyrobaculum aerophilum TaxID=13773 RepID=A0A371QX94_9CREN|nr:ParA family protein [Pyrobaculum aerophilum]RFA95032.1 ATPase [Pyrobaculum aerophilum]